MFALVQCWHAIIFYINDSKFWRFLFRCILPWVVLIQIQNSVYIIYMLTHVTLLLHANKMTDLTGFIQLNEHLKSLTWLISSDFAFTMRGSSYNKKTVRNKITREKNCIEKFALFGFRSGPFFFLNNITEVLTDAVLRSHYLSKFWVKREVPLRNNWALQKS